MEMRIDYCSFIVQHKIKVSALASSSREKAIFMYLDVITALSSPISYVENESFRKFGRAEENISIKYLRKVLFEAVKLVEISIENEMKEAKAAVTHGTRTSHGPHLLGVYAIFMKTNSVRNNGRQSTKEVQATLLLSLAPILSRNEEGDISSEYDINFNTTNNVRQLAHVFNWNNASVYDLGVSQIADSCNLTK